MAMLPLECLQPKFMKQALLALFLLSPMTATMGVQVVTFRMSFFSDAIGHSAFAGTALGLLFTLDPHPSMLLFGIATGLAIMAVKRGGQTSDTATGIVFSAVVAFGLAIVSREHGMTGSVQQFLFGDILTLGEEEIVLLAIIAPIMLVFQFVGYNRLLMVAINPVMAKANGINTAMWQYLFSALLSVVVMVAVWAVGVLLVTALLIVPAATARNLAKTNGGMPWLAIICSLLACISGLLLSAIPFVGMSSGAVIILVACGIFGVSCIYRSIISHNNTLETYTLPKSTAQI